MSRIFADNSQAIGNTPLVMINRLGPKGVTILAKIEGRNPAYSVKCRIGASMIWDAEERGVLKPGMTIVEPSAQLLTDVKAVGAKLTEEWVAKAGDTGRAVIADFRKRIGA